MAGVEPKRAPSYVKIGEEYLMQSRLILAVTALAGLQITRAAAAPLLPDLIVWEQQSQFPSRCYMHCGFTDPDFVPDEVVFRFNGALPNIGSGPLEVREVTHADQTQDVYQRIYDSAGGMSEVLIGSFPGAASVPPRHLWLPGIAQYNLRTVTEGNGLGPIVSSNDKTSMAVVDSRPYDTSLPGAPSSAVYSSVAAPILGISIGHADVYGSDLPGQWVEATGLPSGQYWLEVIADPYDRIQESDETNNITRALVTIDPGDYNDDGAVDAGDYVVWRSTLGEPVTFPGSGADGDGNGAITSADYDEWRANFGKIASTASASPAASVPEPCSIAFAAAAVLLHLLFHHRWRIDARN